MKSNIVIVADNSRARIFTIDSPKSPLQEIESMVQSEGRLHEGDMTSDLPGKILGGAGGGHAYESKTDPKQQQSINFAKRVAQYLDYARKTNKLYNILIVAAPQFLGELRQHMSDETMEMVVFELDKDLTKHSVEDIRTHLPKFLTH
ncbi:MAG: host attachment protein [Pseudomonadota bacterium]|nr:host attachment protein [Pseudomonadota bacterium]